MGLIYFIGGHQRSGTTFLRRLLSQNQQILEFNTDNSIINTEKKVLQFIKKSQIELSDIPKILQYDTFSKYPFEFKDFEFYFISNNSISYRDFFISCIKILLEKFPDKMLLFKTPGLEFYFLELFEISRSLNLTPKFIYSVRNPIDVHKSYKYSSFAWHGKNEPKDKLDSFVITWKNSLAEFLFAKEVLKSDLLLFRFDSFFDNREAQVKEIAAHLELNELNVDWELLKDKQQSSVISNPLAKLEDWEILMLQTLLKKEIIIFFGDSLESRWPRVEDYYSGLLQSIPSSVAISYFFDLVFKKLKRVFIK